MIGGSFRWKAYTRSRESVATALTGPNVQPAGSFAHDSFSSYWELPLPTVVMRPSSGRERGSRSRRSCAFRPSRATGPPGGMIRSPRIERRKGDPMPGHTDLFETMKTMRAMRRLKPDPVPDELIRKILEAGACAPNGGNTQRWRFLVIKDREIKQGVQGSDKRALDEGVRAPYLQSEPPPRGPPEA